MTQVLEVVACAPGPTLPAKPARNVAHLGQPHELVMEITAMVRDLASLQHRHRRALAALTDDDAKSLVDTWCAFHRQLTMARYRAAPIRTDWDEPPEHDPLTMAATVLTAHARLCDEIELAQARGSTPAPSGAGELLRRWHRLRHADPHLRLVIRYVLEHLSGSELGWVRTLVDMIADYLAVEQSLSRIWMASMVDGTELDLDAVAARLSDAERQRDAIEVLVVVAPEPGLPEYALPPIAVSDEVRGLRLRHDVAELLDRYPALLQRCRQTMSRLTSPARAVVSSRVELVQAWGHYDDKLAELRRQFEPGDTGPLSALAVGLLRGECDAAVHQRERVIRCLEAASHIVEGGGAVTRPE